MQDNHTLDQTSGKNDTFDDEGELLVERFTAIKELFAHRVSTLEQKIGAQISESKSLELLNLKGRSRLDEMLSTIAKHQCRINQLRRQVDEAVQRHVETSRQLETLEEENALLKSQLAHKNRFSPASQNHTNNDSHIFARLPHQIVDARIIAHHIFVAMSARFCLMQPNEECSWIQKETAALKDNSVPNLELMINHLTVLNHCLQSATKITAVHGMLRMLCEPIEDPKLLHLENLAVGQGVAKLICFAMNSVGIGAQYRELADRLNRHGKAITAATDTHVPQPNDQDDVHPTFLRVTGELQETTSALRVWPEKNRIEISPKDISWQGQAAQFQRKLKNLREDLHKIKQDHELHMAETEQMLHSSLRKIIRVCSAVAAQTNTHQVAHTYANEVRANANLRARLKKLKGNARVYCHVRPDLPLNLSRAPIDGNWYLKINDTTICQQRPQSEVSIKCVEFDGVFSGPNSQQELVATLQEICMSVTSGERMCVFAYGVTGSGKTHTMRGPQNDTGLVFQSVKAIFNELSQRNPNYFSATAHIQMLELHGEVFRDLLAPHPCFQSSEQPRIRHIRNVGTIVENAQRVQVHTYQDASQVIKQGYTNSQLSSLGAHHSTTIITLSVNTANLAANRFLKGKIHFVECCGCERTARMRDPFYATSAQRRFMSLTSLHQVVISLATNARFAPYRDSKLTYFLKDIFNDVGASMVLIATVLPLHDCDDQLSVMRFAQSFRKLVLREDP